MGYALLLQWSGFLGMVLQLSLCTSNLRYDSMYMTQIFGTDILHFGRFTKS